MPIAFFRRFTGIKSWHWFDDVFFTNLVLNSQRHINGVAMAASCQITPTQAWERFFFIHVEFENGIGVLSSE